MPRGLYNSLKLSSIRSRTTGTHAWQLLFWSSLECWSLPSKTRCESAEVSKVAVEDFCCLLFVFPTSALLKRQENVALGTAAQRRWTAARTEKRKASISRAWSLEALYCLYVFSDVVCLEPCPNELYVEGDRKTIRKSTKKRPAGQKNRASNLLTLWSPYACRRL